MARNIARFNSDIKLAIEHYGSGNVYWAKDASWVKIDNFKLPGNFQEEYTNILILIPENYGYGGCFRDVFIDPNLTLLDKDGKRYRKIKKDIHGFREYPYTSMSETMKKVLKDNNWFYLCLHDKNPESSIVNYLYKVKIYLENPYKDWKAISEKYRR